VVAPMLGQHVPAPDWFRAACMRQVLKSNGGSDRGQTEGRAYIFVGFPLAMWRDNTAIDVASECHARARGATCYPTGKSESDAARHLPNVLVKT
jgi:hypothetical protein